MPRRLPAHTPVSHLASAKHLLSCNRGLRQSTSSPTRTVPPEPSFQTTARRRGLWSTLRSQITQKLYEPRQDGVTLGLNDLRTNCLQAAVLLKEDSGLMHAIQLGADTSYQYQPWEYHGPPLAPMHALVNAAPSHNTFGTPDAERQMHCLLGFPVSQAWRRGSRDFRASSQGNASSTPQQDPPQSWPAFLKRLRARALHLVTKPPAHRHQLAKVWSACGNCWVVSQLDGWWCGLTMSPSDEKVLTSPPQREPTCEECRCLHVVRSRSFCLSDA